MLERQQTGFSLQFFHLNVKLYLIDRGWALVEKFFTKFGNSAMLVRNDQTRVDEFSVSPGYIWSLTFGDRANNAKTPCLTVDSPPPTHFYTIRIFDWSKNRDFRLT